MLVYQRVDLKKKPKILETWKSWGNIIHNIYNLCILFSHSSACFMIFYGGALSHPLSKIMFLMKQNILCISVFLGDNQQPTLGVINELWGCCLQLQPLGPCVTSLARWQCFWACLAQISADPTLGSSTRILRNDQPKTRTSWYIMISRSEKGRAQGFHDKVPETQPIFPFRMPRYMPRIQYIFLPHATCRSIVLQPPLLSFTSGDPEKMNW